MATIEKVGGELAVNSATTGDQNQPRVTALPGGGFVVVWTDGTTQLADATDTKIKAQIYDNAGAKVGGEIQISAPSGHLHHEPDITALAGGGFAAVWTDFSATQVTTVQRYGAAGAPVGGPQVISPEFGAQPSIAGLAGGGFVVTWMDASGSLGDQSLGVKAQIFDASGAAVGGLFRVNSRIPDFQAQPRAVGLVGGGFVITFVDQSGLGGDSSGYGVKSQVFDATGARIGAEALVNTHTLNPQDFPEAAALPGGGFVVAWNDYTGPGGAVVRAQLFGADGVRVGTEITVAASAGNLETLPVVTALASGGFLVSWSAQGVLTAQAFDALGISNGAAVTFGPVDSIDGGPASAMLTNGKLVLTWTGADSSGLGVHAQLLDVAGAAAPLNLVGGPGDETLNGATGDDRLDGAGGDDLLIGGLGADVLIGGEGNDTASYLSASGGITLNLGLSAPQNTGGAGIDRVVSVENLIGSQFGDVLTGGVGGNLLEGRGGNDVLDGALGADVMKGGSGDDAYYVDDAKDQVVESADEGADTVFAGFSYVLGANVENLVLRYGGNATGFGNALDNHLTGNTGANLLDGGVGADVIEGGSGADTVVGGLGADTLTGGDGADTFLFRSFADSFAGGRDLITDLQSADIIDLRQVDANTTLAGDQAFTKVAAFTHHAGEATLQFDGLKTVLGLDVNGDGVADAAINMTGDQTGFSNFLW